MVPPAVLAAARTEAANLLQRPKNWFAAAVIVLLWLAATLAIAWWVAAQFSLI
jgi:uncharacterized membrane protein